MFKFLLGLVIIILIVLAIGFIAGQFFTRRR